MTDPKELIQKHTQGEAVEFVVGWSEDGAGVARCMEALKAQGIPFERLPDRVIGYGDKAVAAVPTAQTIYLEPDIDRGE